MFRLIDWSVFNTLMEVMNNDVTDLKSLEMDIKASKNVFDSVNDIIYTKEHIVLNDILSYTQGIYPFECALMYLTKYFDPDSATMRIARRNIITSIQGIDMWEMSSNATGITIKIIKNIDDLVGDINTTYHDKDMPDEIKYQLTLLDKLRNNILHETIKLRKFVSIM